MTTDKSKQSIDITPGTKVGELINHYPQLEDELIKLAPIFAKLKNPILRRTVARVATLRQAAQVGNIQIGHLINSLRKAAGLEELFENDNGVQAESDIKPDWLNEANLIAVFDARKMISDGEQPLGHVMKELKKLNPGEIYKLITPFYPAPLVDKAKSNGYKVWSVSNDKETVETFICSVQETEN